MRRLVLGFVLAASAALTSAAFAFDNGQYNDVPPDIRAWFKGVIAPTLREEASHAGESLKALPRSLRKALGNGGRWLDEHSRERLHAIVKERPLLATVCEFRARLAGVLERGNSGAEAMMASLQEWCHEAEATGIRTLQEFAARLRGYSLAPVRA